MRTKLGPLAIAAAGLLVSTSGLASAQGYQPAGNVYNQYQSSYSGDYQASMYNPPLLDGSEQWGYATQPTGLAPATAPSHVYNYYGAPPAYAPSAYPAPAYLPPPAYATQAYNGGYPEPPGGQQYSGGYTGNTQSDLGYPGH